MWDVWKCFKNLKKNLTFDWQDKKFLHFLLNLITIVVENEFGDKTWKPKRRTNIQKDVKESWSFNYG